MRSITTLLEFEIRSNEKKTRETIARIRRDGEEVAHPNDICAALEGLPDLFEILAAIQIAEDFSMAERYWASYAFSYLVFKDDYIPDTTKLEIGYLDDLCIMTLILYALFEGGDKTRFDRFTVDAEPISSWIVRVHRLTPHMVPAVTFGKIMELLRNLIPIPV